MFEMDSRQIIHHNVISKKMMKRIKSLQMNFMLKTRV